MKDTQFWALDTQGTLQAVRVNPEGALLSALDSSDITVSNAGDVAHDAVDSGNPVKIGGQARTTNPVAVANGDRVNATFDDLGRQLVIPYQVRDLISTARASLTTGTETALFAGTAGTFHDLIYLMGANESDAAVTLDVRDSLAGGIITSLRIPANGVEQLEFQVPIPQNEAANSWTIDMPDITGTTVNVSALFIKNI